jgi:hypothetical protein
VSKGINEGSPSGGDLWQFAAQKRNRELQVLQARILALPGDLAEALLDDLADALTVVAQLNQTKAYLFWQKQRCV